MENNETQIRGLLNELKSRDATPTDYAKLFEIALSAVDKSSIDSSNKKETQLNFTFDGGTF